MATQSKRSLEVVVGKETYAVWVNMLRNLVPDGRTHRLAVVVAGMLQYALSVVEDQETEENSVATTLRESAETSDPEEIRKLLHTVVNRLFKDAGVKHQRTSARGLDYSIADSAFEEYASWFDMPWES